MIERRLAELGITLPPAAAPAGAYVPALRTGNLVFVSGQLPLREGALVATGLVDATVTLDDARQAAHLCVVNGLAAVRALLGSLDAVRRVVRLTGYVASSAGFTAQPKVVDGASALVRALLGEAGGHTRVAVGVAALPLGSPVEVDLILEVDD